MTLYYNINDVLDRMEESGKALQTLVSVATDPQECRGPREDVFVLASTPKLLNLTDPNDALGFADLLEKVPLFAINMELILDEALTERHKNSVVEQALVAAFDGQDLPNTLRTGDGGDSVLAGGLRHPMLGHMGKVEMCRLYIKFLRALNRDDNRYSFEKNILGKHTERFTESFNGYCLANSGMVKAEILIAFGLRLDHEPGPTLDKYIRAGYEQAAGMKIEDPRELAWAWLEADSYQMRRCHDLSRLIRFDHLPKMPNWVRNDIYSMMGREAMKRVFAEALSRQDMALSILDKTPALRQSVELSARGETDATLKQLAAQIQSASFSGGEELARRFIHGAEIIAAEAHKARL